VTTVDNACGRELKGVEAYNASRAPAGCIDLRLTVLSCGCASLPGRLATLVTRGAPAVETGGSAMPCGLVLPAAKAKLVEGDCEPEVRPVALSNW
jgi:hypothetical protein